MSLKKDEILARLPAGRLLLAISGGVDSVVLLDLLASNIKDASRRLVVAHVDHGIRQESWLDAGFTEQLARKYGLTIYSTDLNLGISASEAIARQARYRFLEKIRVKTGAVAIVTAHHRDDCIETMVFNVLRGTNRRGLTSLADRDGFSRPLLAVSKSDIYEYVLENNLEFVEDETNRSLKYSRNKIRRTILPTLRCRYQDFDERLLAVNRRLSVLNPEIDRQLDKILKRMIADQQIDRFAFRRLPKRIRDEVLVRLLIDQNIDRENIDSSNIDRLDRFIVSAQPAKQHSPSKQITFYSTKQTVIFKPSENR